MKKVISILLLLNILVISAQEEGDPLYTRAGFKAGLNYANVTGDLEDTDARVRMHLGAVIEFPVTQRFYIQAEVLYSAQGYTIDEAGVENEISLNYLALPIIGKYYVTPRFSLETGLRLANLASVSGSAEDTPDDIFDSFNAFDFGWIAGAGYKAESGLFFQLHYNFGLSDINNIDGSDITINNSIAQLSVGYLFKTKNNRRQNDGQ